MRARWLVAAGVVGALVGVGPALGADQTVDATPSNTYVPPTVTVNVGDQVTFRNTGGLHDVRFEDRPAPEVGLSTSAWTVSRRFDQAGSYPFYCTQHGGPGGSGMSGVVTVQAPPPGGTPPPEPTPPGATPPPGPTPAPPGGSAPPPGTAPAGAQPPALAARVLTRRACTRKSATCKRPGVRIAVTAQEAVVVTGQLRRRARRGGFRPSGRVRFSAAKGRSTVTLLRRGGGARIGPGDYRLTLTAVRAAPGSDGARSSQVVLRFAVRR